MKATELVLRLVEYGILFGGLPCASFGFLSSPTHMRSAMEPWGNLKFPFVWNGNVFATRFALLVCLCLVRKCTWMLEQPGKTTLPLLPPIRRLLQPTLKPRLIRWRGTQIFPMVWNWINSICYCSTIWSWSFACLMMDMFCNVAKVDGPDGWLDIKATAWSRQCAKVSIDHITLQNMEILIPRYWTCIMWSKLRPWLGLLPIPMSKTRRNDVQKRKDGMGKEMVKVHHHKSKGTVTVLLG